MSYWFPVCSKVVQFNCENLGCLEKEENRKLEDKKVKVAQFSLTLCDPMDYTVHRILQANQGIFSTQG